MPDNTRPPRNLKAPDEPPLGARAFMSRVDALANCEHFDGFSVEYKRARDGRHCVAILWAGWKREA